MQLQIILFYVKIKAKEKLLSTGQWTSIKEGTSDWAEDKLFILKRAQSLTQLILFN